MQGVTTVPGLHPEERCDLQLLSNRLLSFPKIVIYLSPSSSLSSSAFSLPSPRRVLVWQRYAILGLDKSGCFLNLFLCVVCACYHIVIRTELVSNVSGSDWLLCFDSLIKVQSVPALPPDCGSQKCTNAHTHTLVCFNVQLCLQSGSIFKLFLLLPEITMSFKRLKSSSNFCCKNGLDVLFLYIKLIKSDILCGCNCQPLCMGPFHLSF